MNPGIEHMLAAAMLFASAGAHADDTWILRTDLWHSPAFSTLIAHQDAGRLQGQFDGDAVSGTAKGQEWMLESTDRQG